VVASYLMFQYVLEHRVIFMSCRKSPQQESRFSLFD
jgi:hypothetical protein